MPQEQKLYTNLIQTQEAEAQIAAILADADHKKKIAQEALQLILDQRAAQEAKKVEADKRIAREKEHKARLAKQKRDQLKTFQRKPDAKLADILAHLIPHLTKMSPDLARREFLTVVLNTLRDNKAYIHPVIFDQLTDRAQIVATSSNEKIIKQIVEYAAWLEALSPKDTGRTFLQGELSERDLKIVQSETSSPKAFYLPECLRDYPKKYTKPVEILDVLFFCYNVRKFSIELDPNDPSKRTMRILVGKEHEESRWRVTRMMVEEMTYFNPEIWIIMKDGTERRVKVLHPVRDHAEFHGIPTITNLKPTTTMQNSLIMNIPYLMQCRKNRVAQAV